jgi:hypothetical protein
VHTPLTLHHTTLHYPPLHNPLSTTLTITHTHTYTQLSELRSELAATQDETRKAEVLIGIETYEAMEFALK